MALEQQFARNVEVLDVFDIESSWASIFFLNKIEVIRLDCSIRYKR